MRKLKSFAIVEALLAIAVFAAIVTTSFGAYIYGMQSSAMAGMRTRATSLANEGLEATRSIRDASFASLVDGPHGLLIASNKWTLSGTMDTTDIFSRVVDIQSVDATRKKVTSTISWQQSPQRTGQVQLVTYLTDWQKVTVPPSYLWSNPGADSVFDLTVANSGNNTADAISIAYLSNYTYLGRTNSGGSELIAMDVNNTTAPSIAGRRDLNGNPNAIVTYSNYAYIASTDNASELQIVDISNPATINQAGKLTSVDLTVANSGSNTADAMALAVDGSYLYMARNGGDEILIFNLANPAAPGNPVGRTSALVGVPSDIAISGNYAYVTTDDNSTELQVFNITNKTAPTRVGVLNINNGDQNANGLSVAVISSTNVLVGRQASGGAPELYSINVSAPSAPAISSTMEIGSDVRDIHFDAVLKHAFLATSDAGNDFKVIDIQSAPALPAPPPYGQLNIGNGPQRLVYDPVKNRCFVASSDDAQELQILKPQ